jgi:dienelactone hydrolase
LRSQHEVTIVFSILRYLAPLLLLGGSFSRVAADGPAVRIVSVGMDPASYISDGRLATKQRPLRFQITLANQSERIIRGIVACEIVGNLESVYGLPQETVCLRPHEKRHILAYWNYPTSITFEDLPLGPTRLPGARWGHQLNVAWLNEAGRAEARGQMVFAVEEDGEMPKELRDPNRSLAPQQEFELRYSGYLRNPAFAGVQSLADIDLMLIRGSVRGWKFGHSPSGARTYLAELNPLDRDTKAILTHQTGQQRLLRAYLLEPNHPQGPRARRLAHLSDLKTFTFTLPAVSAGSVLVLEISRSHFIAPYPFEELVAKGEHKYGPYPSPLRERGGKPITTLAQWGEHRKTLKRAVQASLGTVLDARPCPLDPEVVSEEHMAPHAYINGLAGACTRRKVSLQIYPGERIHVWLLVPPGIGPFPAIVANHQTVYEGKDEPVGLGGHYGQLNFGPFLASRGFVVIAADSITFGERLPAQTDTLMDSTPLETKDPNWSMFAQRLHDHRRLIDYLETLPFVTKNRIGAIGHSLGGESTQVLTALDERVAAAVVSCGIPIMRTLEHAGETYCPKGHAIVSRNFRKLLDVPVKDRKLPFDFDDCLALWAPRPVFVHGVSDDLPQFNNAVQVPQALKALKSVYELHRAGRQLYTVYSAQAHCFPSWVQADAFDWLEYWLRQ